eukprot:TRINITY_DN3171_c2_g1_i2.p1 TRINITY_DN3171_c2_g1~~TRINITY_DN3171_c2_g1_i2.p1  ORF type:complete len:979 (+),score=186.11 TRINITY_DN3171_c2_g1_i2:156-3092(+)
MSLRELHTAQPKWGSPCSNVSKADCVGGFPFINAVFRHGSEGVDADLKIADFTQISGLIQRHPARLSINDMMWTRAAADMVQIRSPYFLSWHSSIEDAAYIQQSNLTLLLTNVVASNPIFLNLFSTYKIVEPLPGVRIAVLALSPDEFYAETRPLHPQVTDLNTFLRTIHKVTAVVAVAVQTWSDEDFLQLQQTGIDAVAYIDSANAEPPEPFVNNTMRFVPLKNGRYSMDSFVLEFDNTGKMTGARDVRQYLPTTLPNSFIDAGHEEDLDFIQKLVDEAAAKDSIVGLCTTAMPHGHIKYPNNTKYDSCRHEECHLGTLITDAMISSQNADIALCNGGSLRTGWDAGEVRTSHLEAAFPYPNNLCHVNMTAARLWRALEHSVSAVTAEGGFDPNATISGQFMQMKGLRIVFNPSRPAGNRITSMQTPDANRTGWEDIDPFRQYRIVTNKFICDGGDEYDLTPMPGTVPDTNGVDSWSLLAKRLKDLSPYTPAVHGVVVLDFNTSNPPLKLAKVAEDCGLHAKFVPSWEACTPCYFGYYHPIPGDSPCVPEPVSSPPADYIPVILPLVGGFILFVLAAVYLYWMHLKNARERLTRFAPKGGEVTIVFTDILQSSALWGTLPDSMAVALEMHHRLCRELIAKHEGYEVKTIGDSFMIAFASPQNAVEFTCDAQLQLLKAEWPEDILKHQACLVEPGFKGLRVRMGIHTGTPIVKPTPQGGYDYEGGIVNECARVSDSGCGGQVLVTEPMYKAVEPYLDDLQHVVDVRYLGEYRFKGIANPLSCLQVLPEELLERHFATLRNAELVEYEDEGAPSGGGLHRRTSLKSATTVATEAEGSLKREWISSLQTVRKHVISYGHQGMPANYVASLLCLCVDSKLLDDVMLITVLLEIQRQQSTVLQKAPESPLTGIAGLKWGTLVPVFRSLPKLCVIHIAARLQGDHGGMPLSATTATEPEYRSLGFSMTTPDASLVVSAFSEEM